MSSPGNFSFAGGGVADAYEDLLVPVLFEPWAHHLLAVQDDWKNKRVLDLATGTGIVARLLAEQVGPAGSVVGADLNGEMLSVARQRSAASGHEIEFIESPVHPLNLSDGEFDVVVCQQGFQFFPDRTAAAGEMFRCLKGGGSVVISTWRPVTECGFFGAVCETLESLGEAEISNTMRVPFDFIAGEELARPFEASGFSNVSVENVIKPLEIAGGVEQAVSLAYATPIAPKLRDLPQAAQIQFRDGLTECLRQLTEDGTTMGKMASNLLTARKPV